MANVNLDTRKINGAVEGTRKYYHELGHLNFEESKYGNLTRVFQDLSFKTLVFSTALGLVSKFNIFNYLIVICLLVNIISELYEENWCNNYSKHFGEKEDDRINKDQST
jgi:hypothetical protein